VSGLEASPAKASIVITKDGDYQLERMVVFQADLCIEGAHGVKVRVGKRANVGNGPFRCYS
jgi:hypothetical protein